MNIDPFTLLLIILFVVLPLLNRLTQRQRPGQGPPPDPDADPEPPPQATTRPSQPASAEEELIRRIEEAQRRVQQALGGEAVARPQAEPPKPRPIPREAASLETLRPKPASRETVSLETLQPLKPASREAISLETLQPLTRPTLREAKPLKLQLLGPQRTTSGALGFDRSSLVSGIIWREILDKPLGKRRNRR